VNSLGPKVFISNLPTEVTLTFVKEKGDTNVQFFYLTNWIHILEPTGATPNAYWSAVEIQKIPTEYGS